MGNQTQNTGTSLEVEFQGLCTAMGVTVDDNARRSFLAAKWVAREICQKRHIPPEFARVIEGHAVLGFLERLIDAEYAAPLMLMLKDPEPASRGIAIHCLRRIEGSAWKDCLREAYRNESDLNNRMHIVYTLMHLEGEELIPEFVTYVNTNEAGVLAREFRYLGGAAEIAGHARKRLQQAEYFPKRFLYIKNLGQVGVAADAALLQRFLNDKDEWVKCATLEAINRIRSRAG